MLWVMHHKYNYIKRFEVFPVRCFEQIEPDNINDARELDAVEVKNTTSCLEGNVSHISIRPRAISWVALFSSKENVSLIFKIDWEHTALLVLAWFCCLNS